MNNALTREPPFALFSLRQPLKLALLLWKLQESTLSLILDVQEPEKLSQQKKTVFHVCVKKLRKEDGTGFNAHEF
jgi:hypothetical protein